MSDAHGTDHLGSHDDRHDRGLEYDVATLLGRRRVLGLLGGLGAGAALAACAADGPASSSAGTTSSPSTGSASSTGTATGRGSGTATAAGGSTPDGEVPEETAGPYPGDGSNGPDALAESGIVRSDLTTSYGTSSSRAEGVPLTVHLTVTDAARGYAAMSGAAVYLWHCTRDGQYSMYSQGLEDENYLRGVQATNAAGTSTFTTIFPGCYSGRWPHLHFEVYRSVDEATSDGQIVKTSQIALPEAACRQAYATSGYESSVSHLEQTWLIRDMVFGEDGGVHQLATVTGDATSGYVATLTIGV